MAAFIAVAAHAQTAHFGSSTPPPAVNFSSVAVGTTSSTQTLTFTFDSGGSIGAPVVLTLGAKNLDFADAGTGTCTTNGTSYSYGTGDTCTVDVTFTPKYAGLREGAVELVNSSGAVIVTAYVYGTGTGPQVVFNPSPVTTPLGGGLIDLPGAVAVDGSGNVYFVRWSASLVEEMPPNCASLNCMTVLGGGFANPHGVALDGSGNIYVADSSNSTVKEIPQGCASSSCVATLGGGFNSPRGVAADESGNVYVADTSNNVVKVMPPGCASSSCVTILGGGFSGPFGVAVDASGDVYVADTGNSAIKRILPGCMNASCVTTLGGGFTFPADVAVDGIGDVYVADGVNLANGSTVKEMAPGCASSECVMTLTGGLDAIEGLAVDGSGDVYLAQSSSLNRVKHATPPSLSFATTAVGWTSSDSPQTVTIQNIGNEPLTFPAPSSGVNPRVSINFTWDTSSTCEQVSSGSSTVFTLVPGASCNISVDFAPTTSGNLSGSVVLTDNHLNAVAPNYVKQAISLRGDSFLAPPPAVTGIIPALGDAGGGTPVTITGTNFIGTTAVFFGGAAAPAFTVNSATQITGTSPPGTGTVDVTVTTPAGTSAASAADQFTFVVTVATSLTPSVTPGTTFVYNQQPAISVALAPSDAAGITTTEFTAVLDGTVPLTMTAGANNTFSIALPPTPLIVGSHTIEVSFAGTLAGPPPNYAPSNTTIQLTVTPPAFVVNTTADDATGNAANCTSTPEGACTLRDALAAASTAGGAIITFDPATFGSGATIVLTSGNTLSIPSNTSIQGLTSSSGPSLTNLVTVSGNNVTTVLTVNSGVTNTAISGLVITGGFASYEGGGILNYGTLTVSGSTITGNNSGSDSTEGGGISNEGSMILSNSAVASNTALSYGAAPDEWAAGGGIFNGGTLTITNCTIAGNTVEQTTDEPTGTDNEVYAAGGGVYNGGTLTMNGSTVDGNTASAYFFFSSFLGTVDATGAGLFGVITAGANNIISGNSSNYTEDDCDTWEGVSCPGSGTNGNLFGPNIALADLGDNGGPTPTMIPVPGSAAICAGSYTAAQTAGISSDQRGVAFGNTGAGGYCAPGSIDSGAVQTDYAISFSVQPSDVAQNAAMSPAPAVTLDEDGAPFTASGVTIPLTLTSNPAGATLSGGSVVTRISTGVATYSELSVNQLGTGDTLTVTLELNPAITPVAPVVAAGSGTFDVTPTTVTQLAFNAAPPSTLPAGGDAGTVSVTEENSAGVLVTSAMDSITLTVTGPNGYSQSYTATATNGVVSFNLSGATLDAAGTYTYTAICGAFTQATATQTVNTGSAASVSVVSGNNQSAVIGTAFAAPLVVKVADSYGNPVAGATVIFSAPASGASATFSTPAATDATGQTSVNATANSTASATPYTVTASVTGATTSASFALTNVQQAAQLAGPCSPVSLPYGKGGTFSVSVSAQDSGTGVAPPSGSVTYTIGSGSPQTAAISGGAATLTVPAALAVGSYTVTVSYGGDANYQAAAPIEVSLTVTQAASATALALSSTSITPGQSVTLTATVTDATTGSTGTPTGQVTFYDGTTALGTGALSGGIATYFTADLTAGTTHQLTATYAGDGNFTGSSTSAQVSVVVAPLNFTVTLTGPGTVTVAPGGTLTYSFNVAPDYGSYAGTVTFAASGLPAGATATFSPASIPANGGPQTVAVTITLPQTSAANHPPSSGRHLPPPALALMLLPLAGMLRKRGRALARLMWLLLALAGAAAASGLLGCGSSGEHHVQPQTYTVTVTATAGNLSQSATFTLEVQ